MSLLKIIAKGKHTECTEMNENKKVRFSLPKSIIPVLEIRVKNVVQRSR